MKDKLFNSLRAKKDILKVKGQKKIYIYIYILVNFKD